MFSSSKQSLRSCHFKTDLCPLITQSVLELYSDQKNACGIHTFCYFQQVDLYQLATTGVMAANNQIAFLSEIWSWYGVGLLWLLLRFFVRIKSLELAGLQLDDFFAFWVLVSWTIV